MGDHLALSVDRLATESTPEGATESQKRARSMQHSASSPLVHVVGFGEEEAVECRICQEEDEDSNMEIPCSCNGSLKYVHRKCVQRWCNEKGDTTCEICLQPFEPGYTAPPPPLFRHGSIPSNFRGSWEAFSRDFQDSRFITMVPTDRARAVADSSVDDFNYFSLNQSTVRSRAVTIIFMTLLILRHSLPFLLSGTEEYPLSMFSLLVLRIAGILVPVAIIAGGLTMFHRRRWQQVARSIPVSGSDGDSARSRSVYQPQPLLRERQYIQRS